MKSLSNMSFALILATITCAGHFFQAVGGFPSTHASSSYRSNHHSNDNDHITIELPLSPSVQSPTLLAYINDNSQFETLHSNGDREGGESTLEGTETLSNEDDGTAPSQRNGDDNNNNLRTVSVLGHHQAIDGNSFDTLRTDQVSFPSTSPTDIPFDSLLKRLTQLIERRRNRQRRIQSFRRAILQGTGRSPNSASNMAQARRVALQSLRRRIHG